MKSFSTVRDTQRGSQSYMEKRRARRELEVTQMRWGGINRGESGLASNHFLMCTPQLDHSEMFTELYREEKKEDGDRGGQEDKRGEWKGGRQIQPVIPKHSPPSGTHRDSQSWVEKRRGREEIEATWWRKRRVFMTQQSLCWAYTLRKPESKETHVPQCSSQHCL